MCLCTYEYCTTDGSAAARVIFRFSLILLQCHTVSPTQCPQLVSSLLSLGPPQMQACPALPLGSWIARGIGRGKEVHDERLTGILGQWKRGLPPSLPLDPFRTSMHNESRHLMALSGRLPRQCCSPRTEA